MTVKVAVVVPAFPSNSETSAIETRGAGGGPPQALSVDAVLRGVGTEAVKSALFASVSVQPPSARIAAVEFDSVVPGWEVGRNVVRATHVHVKVFHENKVATTQLYFPDHPRNAGDRLFDPRLVMALNYEHSTGRFDFVVPNL